MCGAATAPNLGPWPDCGPLLCKRRWRRTSCQPAIQPARTMVGHQTGQRTAALRSCTTANFRGILLTVSRLAFHMNFSEWSSCVLTRFYSWPEILMTAPPAAAAVAALPALQGCPIEVELTSGNQTLLSSPILFVNTFNAIQITNQNIP